MNRTCYTLFLWCCYGTCKDLKEDTGLSAEHHTHKVGDKKYFSDGIIRDVNYLKK